MPHYVAVADLKEVSGRNREQGKLFYLYASINRVETTIRLYEVECFHRGDV